MDASRLTALIRNHPSGHALARDFYTDPSIFESDMQGMLLRHWFCAGHVGSIARPGDYLVVELGLESVIIVRTLDGDVRALLNVCRHRGSRLCSGRSGKAQAGRLTCPLSRMDLRFGRTLADCAPDAGIISARGFRS